MSPSLLFGGILLLLFANGCSSVTRFSFRAREDRLELRGPVLVVDPIVDQRLTESTGNLAKTFFPGLPSQSWWTPRPETDELLELAINDDLRSALIRLAAESRTFSQVVQESGQIARQGQVLHLSSRLKTLSLEITWNSYRVGPIAPLFWLIALPQGKLQTTLELELSLTTSLGQKIWSTTFAKERDRLRGFYFNSDWRRSLAEDLEEILRNEWRRVLPEMSRILQDTQ